MNDAALCHHCHVRPPSRPGRPYCSKACSNAARARPLAERLDALAVPGPPGDCWLWGGSLDREGYGVITSDPPRRQLRVHRLVWEQQLGRTLAPGEHVLHTCDNPPCWNPDHLVLGTHRENIADKVSKGRQARGREVNRGHLTDEDVRQIKNGLAHGATLDTLARQYRVSRGTIWFIKTGVTWKHVTE